jgi:hypothetical protein
MDGLGAIRAAISVACIVLARMGKVKAFDHWWMRRNVAAASASKGGSSSGTEESRGSKALITATCWFLRHGSLTSGLILSVQVVGQRVNASVV